MMMDNANSPRLQWLERLTKQAGLSFFAPLPAQPHAGLSSRGDAAQLDQAQKILSETGQSAKEQNGKVAFIGGLPASFRPIAPYRHSGINE